MGLATIDYAQSFSRFRPDILVLLGDRFERHATAFAALPFKIPLAHIHGGELTQGAIDDNFRHSMTKLSHLHFVATGEYSRRVIQMGEEPWRVMNCGALSLDNLRTISLLNPPEIEARYRLRLHREPLLITFHPVTLEFEETAVHFQELLGAVQHFDLPVVFTFPNSDTGGRVIFSMITDFVASHSSAAFVPNLGTQGYFSFMKLAAAMVGNSSSGLIEAPVFQLPVVNVGSRQEGRVKPANIIDVGCSTGEIIDGIKKALEPGFRAGLRDPVNPYGSGGASEKIVQRLKTVNLDQELLMKRFHDLPAQVSA